MLPLTNPASHFPAAQHGVRHLSGHLVVQKGKELEEKQSNSLSALCGYKQLKGSAVCVSMALHQN